MKMHALFGLGALALATAGANAGIVGFTSVINPSYSTSTNGTVNGANRGDLDNIGYANTGDSAPTDGAFYSLGLRRIGNVDAHGYVVMKFSPLVAGGPATIFEVTNGRNTYPYEGVKVDFSNDGSTFTNAVLVDADSGPSGTAGFAFQVPVGNWQYVRITDDSVYSSGVDGFDIDGVQFSVVPVPLAAPAGLALMGGWALRRRFKQ